ncbi:MAG: hypothetical protein CMJ90_12220 [Planctomycetes bacterium]|nr:hypothetical protein [Planctomycetota bacterium]
MRYTFTFACALFVFSAGLAAQTPQTVEGRLLEMLRENGLISATQFEELSGIAAEMRLEQDVVERVAAQVDEMISHLQDEPPVTRYRRSRGWTWESPNGKFRMSLGGRLQVRFTNDFWDKNAETDDENEPDFDVPRARVIMRGNAFSKDIKYKLQFDIAGDEADTEVQPLLGDPVLYKSDNELSELKDAYFQYERWDWMKIRWGQFKVPYSRHFLTSSGELQFVDRSETDKVFTPGRDVGVMISGKAGGADDELFEYYLAAFDGDGENRTNDDHGLLYALRLAVNPLGGVAYTETDVKHSDDFRFALGVNGWLHQDDNHADEGDDWSVGGDLAAFWNGFSLLVEFHYSEMDDVPRDDEALGWLAQLGYFVVPETFEIALRAASIDWEHNGNGNSARREYLVVLGYFWRDHDLKAQMDFGRIEDHEGDPDDNRDEWRLRLQLQVIF